MSNQRNLSRPLITFTPALILTVFALLTVYSCSDKEDYRFDTTYNKNTTQEFLNSDALFVDFFRLAYKASMDTSLLNNANSLIDSARVTMADSAHVVFSYGNSMKCPDGTVRSGQILLEWNSPLTDSAARITMQPQNLIINGKTITGNIVIRRTLLGYRPAFTYQISEGIIALNDTFQKQIHYACNYLFEFRKGSETPYTLLDDVFKISGNAQGKGTQYDRFTYQTTDTLTLKMTCRYLRGGKAEMVMPDFEINTADIDYLKAEECSAIVNVEFWGVTPNGAKKRSESTKLTISI